MSNETKCYTHGAEWCAYHCRRLAECETESLREQLQKAQETIAAHSQHCVEMAARDCMNIEKLQSDLAECYRLTGADPDGNEDWRLAERTVAAVKEFRQEFDELADTNTRLALGWDAESNTVRRKDEEITKLRAVMFSPGVRSAIRYSYLHLSEASAPERQDILAASALILLHEATIESLSTSQENCGATSQEKEP